MPATHAGPVHGDLQGLDQGMAGRRSAVQPGSSDLLHQPRGHDSQPGSQFIASATDFMLKQFSVNKITPTVSRLFLEIRMECAECHNHPLENSPRTTFTAWQRFSRGFMSNMATANYRRTWFLEDDGEAVHPLTKARPHEFLGGSRPKFQPMKTVAWSWPIGSLHPKILILREPQSIEFGMSISTPDRSTFRRFGSTDMPTRSRTVGSPGTVFCRLWLSPQRGAPHHFEVPHLPGILRAFPLKPVSPFSNSSLHGISRASCLRRYCWIQSSR